jgi:ribosomal protein L37E
MARMNHYVCDRCGNYYRAMHSKRCPACKHEALWEYPPERQMAARLQSMRIRDPKQTVEPLA